MTSYANIF